MEFDVWTIVSAVLGLIAVVAGGVWLKAKGKLLELADLVKQAYEVVEKLHEVLQDDKVDKAEVETLKSELSDVKRAFNTLVGKG